MEIKINHEQLVQDYGRTQYTTEEHQDWALKVLHVNKKKLDGDLEQNYLAESIEKLRKLKDLPEYLPLTFYRDIFDTLLHAASLSKKGAS